MQFHFDLVLLDFDVKNKDDLFQRLAEILLEKGNISNKDQFIRALYAREDEISTGIGDGIAIPHAKSDSVVKSTLIFTRLSKAIEYHALDQKKVDLVFMIAMLKDGHQAHLKVLSEIAKRLLNQETRYILKHTQDPKEIVKLFEV